ncbi:MAG: hypothetical protein SVP52_03090, partial [Chloroflexota bacterium]|nr:hypothetical protein [Chloroflexota bacterium]
DQALGGGVIGPFFWKNLRNGEEVSMYFHPEDFPDEADLSQFSIEYTFENADDEAFVVNDLFELDAQYGKDYRVSLTGNRLDGFDLSLMD